MKKNAGNQANQTKKKSSFAGKMQGVISGVQGFLSPDRHYVPEEVLAAWDKTWMDMAMLYEDKVAKAEVSPNLKPLSDDVDEKMAVESLALAQSINYNFDKDSVLLEALQGRVKGNSGSLEKWKGMLVETDSPNKVGLALQDYYFFPYDRRIEKAMTAMEEFELFANSVGKTKKISCEPVVLPYYDNEAGRVVGLQFNAEFENPKDAEKFRMVALRLKHPDDSLGEADSELKPYTEEDVLRVMGPEFIAAEAERREAKYKFKECLAAVDMIYYLRGEHIKEAAERGVYPQEIHYDRAKEAAYVDFAMQKARRQNAKKEVEKNMAVAGMDTENMKRWDLDNQRYANTWGSPEYKARMDGYAKSNVFDQSWDTGIATVHQASSGNHR